MNYIIVWNMLSNKLFMNNLINYVFMHLHLVTMTENYQ